MERLPYPSDGVVNEGEGKEEEEEEEEVEGTHNIRQDYYDEEFELGPTAEENDGVELVYLERYIKDGDYYFIYDYNHNDNGGGSVDDYDYYQHNKKDNTNNKEDNNSAETSKDGQRELQRSLNHLQLRRGYGGGYYTIGYGGYGGKEYRGIVQKSYRSLLVQFVCAFKALCWMFLEGKLETWGRFRDCVI